MTLGFRVLKRKRKVDAGWVEKFRSIPVANISDCIFRMTGGGARLRPYHSGGVLCGPALTVKSRPGDNLMVHYALNLAEPGDIIVADCGGEVVNSIVGERMLAYAERKGFGGMIIDGAIRDVAYVRSRNFPVYAAGVTHRGPYKDGPGEINVPIAIDGMVIEPGDLILGDDDGLLCVPFDAVETVLAAATRKAEAEAKQMANIEAGTHDASWVDATLRRLNCEGLE